MERRKIIWQIASACLLGISLIPGHYVFAQALNLPQANAQFREHNPQAVKLGQLLFYDPVISGNATVACASCHHPRFGTSDGLSLGLGDGGSGLGPQRSATVDNPPERLIPRNSPALFNLGALEFQTLFHDGRLERDDSMPHGIRTPLGADMVEGFASVLAAQTMFPVLSADEMAGHYVENAVARQVRIGVLTGTGGAWHLIAQRVASIAAYQQLFSALIGERDIRFADIANVIAAFIEVEWRADQSIFDAYLRGEVQLSGEQQQGLALFYGKAGCSRCHSGQFQTDHRFHAIAMPQFGPGKAGRFESHKRDVGRMRVTGNSAHIYQFRTPSLRNITQTAPYGHNGAYRTLEAVIRHHLDPVNALLNYDPSQLVLPVAPELGDITLLSDKGEVEAIANANALQPINLDQAEIKALIAFLGTLDDKTSLKGRLGIPLSVPSGLPVAQ